MATITKDSAATTVAVPQPDGMKVVAYDSGAVTINTTDLDAADIIQMVRLPVDCKIIGGWLTVTDMDTNCTPTLVLDVGYGDDPDGLIDGSTKGQGGGTEYFGGNALAVGMHTPIELTAEDTIDITISAASATAAAGTARLVVLAIESRN